MGLTRQLLAEVGQDSSSLLLAVTFLLAIPNKTGSVNHPHSQPGASNDILAVSEGQRPAGHHEQPATEALT